MKNRHLVHVLFFTILPTSTMYMETLHKDTWKYITKSCFTVTLHNDISYSIQVMFIPVVLIMWYWISTQVSDNLKFETLIWIMKAIRAKNFCPRSWVCASIWMANLLCVFSWFQDLSLLILALLLKENNKNVICHIYSINTDRRSFLKYFRHNAVNKKGNHCHIKQFFQNILGLSLVNVGSVFLLETPE